MSAVMKAVHYANDLYAELEALPENLTGEIINGRLYAQPRPANRHALVESGLAMDIGSAYHRGRGGPGGWWILVEPEIHFIRDEEVLVPDLAGWRRNRMPRLPPDHRIEIVPDWVCEILSPSTARKDRLTKMPVYARYGVPTLWLDIDRAVPGSGHCQRRAVSGDRAGTGRVVGIHGGLMRNRPYAAVLE